ncbi:hypothetical protein ACH4UV_06865 [Streptomyces sp. NPDC020802]|uniref:effector-associated constant component EACC1 n=1 Tax=Streptomyces sp. NPDC020802 TaxID=3365094 RepID=UPI0037BB1153
MTGFAFQVDPTDLMIRAGLERWLLADDRLRGTMRVTSSPTGASAAHDEHLGDPLSVIAVVLSTALGLPAFLDSVRRWFATQPPQTPPLTLTRGTVTVLIPQDMDSAKVAELANALSAAELPPPTDGDPEGTGGPEGPEGPAGAADS